MPHTFLKKLWYQGAGVALIEFAIVFPILLMLVFGAIEIARLMLIHQKLEKVGYVVADIVTQYYPAENGGPGTLTEAEMKTNVLPIYDHIMRPYDLPAREKIIVTSIQKQSGILKIMWQVSGGGSLSGCDTTCVASVTNNYAPGGDLYAANDTALGTTASFTNDPTLIPILSNMTEGENMIVSEAFYHYEPLLLQLLNIGTPGTTYAFVKPRNYAKRTFFAPRQGNLLFLPPTFPVH